MWLNVNSTANIFYKLTVLYLKIFIDGQHIDPQSK